MAEVKDKVITVEGLGFLHDYDKRTYSDKSHTHTVDDVSGILPLNKGGTGASTASTALKNLGITATASELSKLSGVTSNIQNQIDNLSKDKNTKTFYTLTQLADYAGVNVSTLTDLSSVVKTMPNGSILIGGTGLGDFANLSLLDRDGNNPFTSNGLLEIVKYNEARNVIRLSRSTASSSNNSVSNTHYMSDTNEIAPWAETPGIWYNVPHTGITSIATGSSPYINADSSTAENNFFYISSGGAFVFKKPGTYVFHIMSYISPVNGYTALNMWRKLISESGYSNYKLLGVKVASGTYNISVPIDVANVGDRFQMRITNDSGAAIGVYDTAVRVEYAGSHAY